jgi:hypothetical protein
MPNDCDPAKVQICSIPAHAGKVIDCRDHIIQRARPATSRFADAPVFDIPRSISPQGEIRGYLRQPLPPVRQSPESTVQEAHDRSRASCIRQVKITHLIFVFTIANDLWHDASQGRLRLGSNMPTSVR